MDGFNDSESNVNNNAAGTNNSQDSSSDTQQSTYSYSYKNQETKDPNMTWRASDNTASGTYSTQYSNGYNESSGYSQGSQSYNQNTSGYYNQEYYNQNSSDYTDASKDAKPKKKFFKKRNNNINKVYSNKSGFGKTIGKAVIIAVVFGLVAGGIFVGISKANLSDQSVASNSGQSSSDSEDGTQDSSLNTDGEIDAAQIQSGADVSDIVSSVMPAIVAITNMGEYETEWFGQTFTQEAESSGSGVIISQDDDYIYIATNNHVVESSQTLTVTFVDDSTATAQIKGTDSSSDLAVISIEIDSLSDETKNSIKVATLGDSDALEVGDSAIAIGNALGYGQSVTTGVISALNREVTLSDETTGESITNELLQTDAAINPGNSGGALLNAEGDVIGINSAKYSDTTVEGMGFAIPMSTAEPILNDLITREKVDSSKSAYLGVSAVDVTSDIAEAYGMPEGVYVAQVVEGSAAETAGIKQGDIITEFDGKKITSMEYLTEQLQYYESGTKVKIVIQRANNGEYEEQTLTVKLGSKN